MPVEKTANKGGIDPAEFEAHRGVLEAQAETVRKRLDKGVPRAEFQQLHALSRAVKRASGALDEIRTAVDDA